MPQNRSQRASDLFTVAQLKSICHDYGVALPVKTRKPALYAVAKRLKRATSITDNYLAQTRRAITPAQRRRIRKAHNRASALVARYGA